MKGKIVLEEHLTTDLNNSLWNASGEAARNGKAYMDDVDARLLDFYQTLELIQNSDVTAGLRL